MGSMNAIQLFLAGGPVMFPIALCSVAALTIILSKWITFKNNKTDFGRLRAETFALIRANKIKPAILLCETKSSAAARILIAGLVKFGSPRFEIKETVENATALEIPELEKGLVALITIANIAPLFGVLGTVLGMTVIFQTIQSQNANMHLITAADLAGGIWQALLTSIAGLIVAIPAFAAYNYFLNIVNTSVNDLDRIGNDLVDLLTRLNESNNTQISEIAE